MDSAQLTRRRLMRWLAVGGATSMALPPLAAILEACSSSSAPPQKTGGTVSFALSIEPKVLNPVIKTLQSESTVTALIFPGLLRVNRDGRYEPELAESYRVEDGGMTYRFKLRPHLKWQDGKPVTSSDFLFTHQTYVDPKTGASLRGWDRVERVETPDDTTVAYRMKEAYAPFLLDVGTGPVLPRHVLAGTQNIRRDQFNRNPVGCGPFKLSDWQSGSSIRLEANGTYWRRRPNLDRFLFKIVPDATTQIDQLQTGEVDIVNVAQLALWEHVKGLGPAVATALYDDFRYAFVQLDQYGFLKDVTVRQALDYATPKKAIIQGVLRNLAVPALTDVPPRSPYYNPNVERHDYDEVKASAVLAQAGFTMQNGILTKAGQPLEVPIYTVASSPAYVQLAQVLKDSWSRIGVKTSVTTMEASTLFSKQGPQWNGKDAALIYSISPGADPYNYVNWSSQQIPNTEDDPGQNYGRYANPVVDKLVVKGAQVVDFGQRKKVYDELQQILAHDVPVIFVYFPKALFAYNSKLRGFQPDPFSGLFAGVWDWTKS